MLDILSNAYMAATEPILQEDKYVIPMGMRLSRDGEASFVGLMSEEENDDPAKHIRAYRKLLEQTSSDDIACLLAYNVRLKETPEYADAIAIEIETKSGTRVRLIVPYKFTGWRKKLQLGPIERNEPGPDKIYSK